MYVHFVGKRAKREGCLFSGGGETQSFFSARMMKHWGNLLHDFTTKYSKTRGGSCSWGNSTCWAVLQNSQANMGMGVCCCSSQDFSRELLHNTDILSLFCFSRIPLPTPLLGFAVPAWWLAVPGEVSGWCAWQLCPKARGKAMLTFPADRHACSKRPDEALVGTAWPQTEHCLLKLSSVLFWNSTAAWVWPRAGGELVEVPRQPAHGYPCFSRWDHHALVFLPKICLFGFTGGYCITCDVLTQISMQIIRESKRMGSYKVIS